MTIDNEANIFNLQKRRVIRNIIFLPLIISLALVMAFENDFMGIPDSLIITVFIILFISYVIISVYFYQIDYNYFQFTDTSGKLVFKYYSLRNNSAKHKTIEIPKKSFVKFQVKRSLFDKKEELILFQRIQQGIAKYPPISLSALDENKRNKLKETLFNHMNKKQD